MNVSKIIVRWEGVSGATGYEVRKDGIVVGTRGPKARTTTIIVDDQTKVEVTDLPVRKLTQEIDFSQVAG